MAAAGYDGSTPGSAVSLGTLTVSVEAIATLGYLFKRR